MKKQKLSWTKNILPLSLLMTIPRGALAHGQTAPITSQEAEQITRKLLELTDPKNSSRLTESQKALFKALGVDPLNCTAYLLRGKSMQAIGSTGEQIFVRLLSAPQDFQALSKKVILGKRELTETELKRVNSVVLTTQNPFDLTFDETKQGIFARIFKQPSIPADFDRIEAYSLFAGMIRELNEQKLLPSQLASVKLDQLVARADGSLMILATLTDSRGNPFQIKFKEEMQSSAEQTVANVLVGAVSHFALIQSPELLTAEVNKLRHDLIALIRISDLSDRRKIANLIRHLETFSSPSANDPSYIGTALGYLRDVKKGFATIVQAKLAVAHQKDPTSLKFVPKTDVSAPVYRQRGATGYYAQEHQDRGDNLLWIWDPWFMMNHPWYWGVNSNSPLSYLMWFEYMTDHTTYPGTHFTPPQSPDDYQAPAYPYLSRDNEHPVTDSTQNSGIQGNADAWKYYVTEQNTDWSRSQTTQDSSSHTTQTGWNNSQTTPNVEEPSTTWNTTTTGTETPITTTTGTDFTTTTTTTTTTGYDSTTTTTTTTGYDSTTTTGYDSTTTTTTGFDSTTTTGGSDW